MTTDERDKGSHKQESKARVTARDVPFVRSAGSESEPAPRGQRPAELPRDPTYEAELANVELAVLRDRDRRDDPSTKQGGRRGHQLPPGQPPESVTPESPGTRAARDVAISRSPEPPTSSGRSVASGTLLSVGSVDPRGKTERTLETPRMYFSRPDTAGEAYFKPGKIPSVTVHQTLETETVKLSDSIDPRRAKTLPRIDRAALMRYAEGEEPTDSEDGSMAVSQPASLDVRGSEESPRWNQDEYEPGSLPSGLEADGQIHASLSPFRDQQEPEPSYDYEAGVPTRAEPLAARRLSDTPPPPPDPSTVPTHRDLPQHRIEASRPPPPPAEKSAPRVASSSPRAAVESVIPMSEGPRPTTASIIEEPPARPVWQNATAFVVALLVALALGWWLTGGGNSHEAARGAPGATPSVALPAAPAVELKPAEPVEPAPPPAAAKPAQAPAAQPAATPSPPPAQPAGVATPPANAAPQAPLKQTPAKSSRETIF